MLRFLLRRIAQSKVRSSAIVGGVVVSLLSFVLLTAAVNTNQLQVRGTVEENFRPAYDILVRPSNSYSSIERSRRLVRENYLSGIYGGITFADYRAVQEIKTVDVAAPIANLGYVTLFKGLPVRIDRLLDEDAVQLFRIRSRWVADRGLSTYPNADNYVYYTRNRLVRLSGPGGLGERVPGFRRPLPVCGGYQAKIAEGIKPFDPLLATSLSCFSEASPKLPTEARLAKGRVGERIFTAFPVAAAAIDPIEETKLVALDEAMVDGRYLRPNDGPFLERNKTTALSSGIDHRLSPAIASSKLFVDEELEIDIERLSAPDLEVPKKLAGLGAYRFLKNLEGDVVTRRRIDLRDLRGGLLEDSIFSHYWTTSSVEYRAGDDGHITPEQLRNPISVWSDPSFAGGYFSPPPDNRDVHFRRLHQRVGSNLIGPGNIGRLPGLTVVGTFNPEKLPGFSRLSRVPLETYYPPRLDPLGDKSRELLGDRPLLPSQNLGGYIAQPPTLLLTLRGLKPFLNPNNYAGADREAPISVIRVRVKGVTGADPVSRERIRRVAAAIHERTGLAVDITAGSSPTMIPIDLPPGKFGRPPLTLAEGWVQKGVAVKFLTALDKKSLLLFCLILLISGLFLSNSTFATVKARQTEIGVLRCLGWGRRRIFVAVLGELAVLGGVAGALGTFLVLVVIATTGLALPLTRVLIVLPLGVVLAVASAFVPARKASSVMPLDAVHPVVAKGRRLLAVKGTNSMALVNLARVPSRAIIGSAGLALGVGALTFLVAVNLGFREVLVGSLLGQYISIEVRAVDFLSVGLTIVLAAMSVVDSIFLSLKERSAEFATLITVGWKDRYLRRVAVIEAVVMAVAGSMVGTVLGIGATMLIGGLPLAPAAWAGVVGSVGAILLTTLACAVPVNRLSSPAPVIALAEE